MDGELTARAARGDVNAFIDLVRPGQAALRAFCARLSADKDAADDLAQEVLLAAFESFGSFDPPRDLGKRGDRGQAVARGDTSRCRLRPRACRIRGRAQLPRGARRRCSAQEDRGIAMTATRQVLEFDPLPAATPLEDEEVMMKRSDAPAARALCLEQDGASC